MLSSPGRHSIPLTSPPIAICMNNDSANKIALNKFYTKQGKYSVIKHHQSTEAVEQNNFEMLHALSSENPTDILIKSTTNYASLRLKICTYRYQEHATREDCCNAKPYYFFLSSCLGTVASLSPRTLQLTHYKYSQTL